MRRHRLGNRGIIVLAISALALTGCQLSSQQTDQTNQNTDAITCGGLAGILCPQDYMCEYTNPKIIDGTGTCIPKVVEP